MTWPNDSQTRFCHYTWIPLDRPHWKTASVLGTVCMPASTMGWDGKTVLFKSWWWIKKTEGEKDAKIISCREIVVCCLFHLEMLHTMFSASWLLIMKTAGIYELWLWQRSLYHCCLVFLCISNVVVIIPLQWRHNDHYGFSNHQPNDCLLVYSAHIKENTKAQHHWSLCREFTSDRWIPLTKGPVIWKMFLFYEVIMYFTIVEYD